MPSCRWRRVPAVGCPTAPVRCVRLQGLAPCESPSSPSDCLDLPSTRSPLELFFPRVFLPAPSERLHAPSVHDLPRFDPRWSSTCCQCGAWWCCNRLPVRSSWPAVSCEVGRGRVCQAVRFDRRTSRSLSERRTNFGARASARDQRRVLDEKCRDFGHPCEQAEGNLRRSCSPPRHPTTIWMSWPVDVHDRDDRRRCRRTRQAGRSIRDFSQITAFAT
jgi:hypothetical protein